MLRKKIGQLTTLINCKTTGNFTNHQKEIKKKFDKNYGNTRLTTLNFNLTLLKQELKATSIKLKLHKKKYERQVINNKLNTNPKSVYRDFKGNNITLTNLVAKDEVEDFWKDIWATETNFNKNAKWLKELEKTYRKNVTPKTYKIDQKMVDKVINNMHLNKSLGKDLIRAFWLKKLHFYRDRLTELYQNTYEGNGILPLWLTEAKTTLIAKSEQTENAKNYRPVACLNLTYKIYTSCLNIFLTDHCDQNNIITSEQVAVKKRVWGCVEQLLLNKAVLSEVKKKRRNIFTVWLDYKKAFDSVPHEWLLYALQLAKVPAQLLRQ